MRKPLLLACALAALPAFPARAACPADEAVERLALGIVENRPGEPLAGMTSLADNSCPRAFASASNRSQNSSKGTSFRSNFAHAFVSGSVALIVRMKSFGRPFSCSYRAKASKGLERMTPPKSHNTALRSVA